MRKSLKSILTIMLALCIVVASSCLSYANAGSNKATQSEKKQEIKVKSAKSHKGDKKSGDNKKETLPEIVSVTATSNTSVQVVFNRKVNIRKASFTIAQKYGTKADLKVLSTKLDKNKTTVELSTASQQEATLYGLTVTGLKYHRTKKSGDLTAVFVGMGTPQPTPPPIVEGAPQILTVVAVDNTSIAVTFDVEVDISNAVFAINEMYGAKAALGVSSTSLSDDKKTVTLSTASQNAALYQVKADGVKTLDGLTAGELTSVFVGILPDPTIN